MSETTMAPWWAEWQVDVPEGESGRWKVRRVAVDEEEAKWGQVRAVVGGSGRYVPEGRYTQLLRGSTVVMSDTPDEIRDHRAPVYQARQHGGRVLIHGLGLGMVLRRMLAFPNVEHVDVVEKSEDVIQLVGQGYAEDPRVTIHHGDALTYLWPKGVRWSIAWHDIWDDLCTDNLEQMAQLHRRFARRCDWQGSWGREILRVQRQRERRRGW